MAEDHYETLGLTRDATPAQIKKAYKKLAMQLHPDKCEFGANLFKKVGAAYEVLSDERKRREYDRSSARSTSRQQHQSQAWQQSWSSPNGGNSRSHHRGGGFNWGSRGGSSSYHSANAGRGGPSSDQRRYGTNNHSYNNRNGYNKENDSKQKEDASHERFICIICKEIVKKDFWETFCCHKVCCTDCLGIDVPPPHAKNRTICPNASCQKPMNVRAGTLIDGWTRGSKFLLKQLEAVAPTHAPCGRNILPKDLSAHMAVCPALNTSCFKCSGAGKIKSVFGTELQCHSCNGRKYLRGDWTKCFQCSGTGLDSKGSSAPSFGAGLCTDCSGKGAISGKWMLCFRCTGKGSVTEELEPGSLSFPYKETTKTDGCSTIVLQSITAMPKYAHTSFEELRMEDYLAGNRGAKGPTSLRQASGGKLRSPGKKKKLQPVDCTVCDAKGRIEGKWTVCFCCEGSGSTMNSKLKYTCNACSGKGAHKGFNLRPCHLCMGGGCETCSWKGSEKCNCGASCRGHESDL